MARFARKCSVCGTGMDTGWCEETTPRYYCSLTCRRTEYTDEDWNDRYDDGDGDCYWSDFTDDPDDTLTDWVYPESFRKEDKT